MSGPELISRPKELLYIKEANLVPVNRHFTKKIYRDFPGGAVVKNPPANAGDTGLSPGPGRSHMPWSN